MNECDAIVITGDISHSSTIDPQTAYYIREYFSEITSNFGGRVIVIPGQHDQSSKSLTHAREHVILTTLLSEFESVEFYASPSRIQLCGLSVFVDPWNHNVITESEPADIYLGHGIVSGSKDAHGYQFVTGMNAEDLMSKYRLSIIGDLHSGQIFKSQDNENRVLVPGTPIQTSFKDDPNVGMWVISIDDEIDFKFVPTYEVSNYRYHQFIYVKEDELASSYPEEVHVKIVRNKKDAKVKSEYVSNTVSDVIDVARKLIDESKFENTKMAMDFFEQIVESSKTATTKSIPQVNFESLTVKSFLSIDQLSIDFSSMGGEWLIVGLNGAGKTSIAEAMFYLLTNRTTKNVPISELSNYDSKSGLHLDGVIRIEDQRYRIIRSRDGGPQLHVYKLLEDGTEIGLDKSSMKETQAYLEGLIGVSPWWIFLMCYFSTNALQTFSAAGGSDQNDLLGTLVGVEIIESLRESSKQLIQQSMNQYRVAVTETELLQRAVSDHQSTIARMEDEIEKNKKNQDYSTMLEDVADALGIEVPTSIIDARKILNKCIDDINSQIDEKAITDHNQLTSRLRDLRNNRDAADAKVESISKKISQMKSQYVTVSDNKCFTCHQDLPNDDVKNKLEGELQELSDQMLLADEILSTTQSEIEELQSVEPEYKEKSSHSALLKFKRDSWIQLERKISSAVMDSMTTDLDAQVKVRKELLEYDISKLQSIVDQMSDLKLKVDTYKSVDKLFDRNGALVSSMTKIACGALQEEVNRLVGDSKIYEMTVSPGKNVAIHSSFYRGRRIPIEGQSGGERRLSDILITIAIINLVSRRYNLPDGLLGVVMFDEMYSHLDHRYVEIAYQALCMCTTRLKFVITHDPNLQSHFHQLMHVKKVQGNSVYSW